MKLDTNAAWGEAVALVSANRQVLWAIAGVFFVLPSFAFSVLYPQPEILPGTGPEQILAQFEKAYEGAWPFVIISALLQMLGTLTVLTLFTDRTRPTVGEAIKIAAVGVPTFIGTQLILIVGVLLVSLLIGLLVAGLGTPAVAAVLLIVALVAFIYAAVRLALLGPVIAVEGQRNPIAVLQRSWALTNGNVGRILLFFVLVGLAFLIVISLIMLVIGLLLAVLLGGEGARVGAALISAMFGAAAQLYFTAILAAIHRQLAGPSAERVAEPFS